MAQSKTKHLRNRPREIYAFPAPGPNQARRTPRRSSLVDETAGVLKDWIRRGLLKELMPGEKHLKARLGVSRGTVRRSLAALAREGWISAADKGCNRQVLLHSPTATRAEPRDDLPATFLSPHPVEHQVTLQELEETRTRLAALGRNLRYLSPRIFNLRNPARHLERLVQAHPSAVWILSATSEPIQRWFAAQNLPVLLHELPFPGVSLPFVTSDWEAAAYDAGSRLAALGHRTIGILEHLELRSEVLAQEQGLQKALSAAHPPGRLFTFRDDGAPDSVARSLDKAFASKERPTALVLTRAAQLLTCYSWMAWRGIRVPADVSVVALANDSWFKDLYPTVCYYRPNSRKMSRGIAERVLEIALAGQLKGRSLQTRLDFIPGASVGPVNLQRGGGSFF